eukprot:702508-Rhodomonas_salina.3
MAVPGSFSCVCNAGYGGNGAICVQQVQCEQCEDAMSGTDFRYAATRLRWSSLPSWTWSVELCDVRY